MDDQELIRKYFDGDEEAFRTLVQRYLKPIYNFVHTSVRDDQHAEDITQDVFIKVWTHLRRFDLSKNFKVWIYTIAKNSIFDFLRKKKTVPFSFLEKEDEIYDIPDAGPLPDKILQSADSADKLEGALSRLPLQYREVLILYYKDGFNFREIAEIFKTPVNTVKSRHLRALNMLKKNYAKKDNR